LTPEAAEEIERPPPPCALAVCASFVGLRGRNVQDAPKFALVFVLHRAWIRLSTHAQPNTTRTQRVALMQRSSVELKNCSLWLRTSQAPCGGRPPARPRWNGSSPPFPCPPKRQAACARRRLGAHQHWAMLAYSERTLSTRYPDYSW